MKNDSVAKNYLYNAFYQIFTVITPLLTTPYISRVLGAYNIGIFGYAQSIVTYFVLFGSLGSSLYGQREIAYVQHDIPARSRVFREIVRLRFLVVFIATAIYLVAFSNHEEGRQVFVVLAIEVAASALDISWFFMGIQNFKKSVIRNITVKLLGIVLIFLFVKKPDDVAIYAACYAVPIFISNLSLWIGLHRYIDKSKPEHRLAFKHILPLLVLLVPQIATEVYLVLDKTMLGILSSGMDQVGFYEQSQKIIKVFVKLLTALGLVMLPRIADMFVAGQTEKIKQSTQNSFRFIFTLGFPLMFGMIGITDSFVPWFFGDGYEAVNVLIKIISPIIVIIGISNILGKQYLLPTGRQKVYTASVVVGAIVNFVLNALLIPRYNAFGASIGTVVAETCVTLVQAIGVRKELPSGRYLMLSIKPLAVSVIMMFVVILVGQSLPAAITTTLLQIVIGFAVYVAGLVIVRDSTVKDIIQYLEKKYSKRTR